MGTVAYRFGENSQVAFASRDIQATMTHFSRIGIGPWFVLPSGLLPNARFRGQPADIEMSVAFSNCRGLEYELLQQLNDTPSIWSGFLDGREERERYHHSCLRTDDLEGLLATMQADGYTVALDGETHRGRFTYVEHPEHPAAYVELLEQSPSRRAMEAHVRAAAERWDGTDPVRPMPNL